MNKNLFFIWAIVFALTINVFCINLFSSSVFADDSFLFSGKSIEALDSIDLNSEILYRLMSSDLKTRKADILVSFMKDILRASSNCQMSDSDFVNSLRISGKLQEEARAHYKSAPDSKFFKKVIVNLDRFDNEIHKRYVPLDGPVADAIEKNLGSQFHSSILQQYPLSGENEQDRVVENAKGVFKLAKKDRKFGKYEVFAIKMEQNGTPVPNAFCAPGGFIYVSSELLRLIDDNDVLKFVIGHEAGHHINEDTAKKLKMTLALFPLKIIPGIKKLVARFIDSPIAIKAEYRADRYGTLCNSRLGCDPASGIVFLKKLTELFGNLEPGPYGDHPSNSDRIESIQKYIDENNLKVANDNQ